jgi:hypothetical protein
MRCLAAGRATGRACRALSFSSVQPVHQELGKMSLRRLIKLMYQSPSNQSAFEGSKVESSINQAF